MDNLNHTCVGSKEFYQSKRLFSLAFVNILNKMGSEYTRDKLKLIFEESTFSLFPDVLTEKNLETTIHNFKTEDVIFR